MIPGPRSTFMMALLQSRAAGTVNADHVERLKGAADGSDARGILRGTDLGATLEGASHANARERDEFLWSYMDQQIALLEEGTFLPGEASVFARAYARKFDVANIKAVIQALAEGAKPALLPVGALHRGGFLDSLEAADTVEDVMEILARAGLEPFAAILRGSDAAPGWAESTALEAEYHRSLGAAVRGLGGGKTLAHACGVILDLENLALFLRAVVGGWGAAAAARFIPPGYMLDTDDLKEALSLGLKEVSRRIENARYRAIAEEVAEAASGAAGMAATDDIIAKHRMDLLRGLLATQTSPACVAAWFLFVKETEVRNVRLLLKAVENGLSFERAGRCLVL